MNPLQCPYCGAIAVKVTGEAIYPHRPDLHKMLFYLCKPCDAYVGCHPGTSKPLGRLANAALRKAKMAAHAAFDPLWRSGKTSRSNAYKWLAQQLKIKQKRCHIGMMDIDLCHKVVEVCAGHR